MGTLTMATSIASTASAQASTRAPTTRGSRRDRLQMLRAPPRSLRLHVPPHLHMHTHARPRPRPPPARSHTPPTPSGHSHNAHHAGSFSAKAKFAILPACAQSVQRRGGAGCLIASAGNIAGAAVCGRQRKLREKTSTYNSHRRERASQVNVKYTGVQR
ncbi:hypothetical protein C8F04DRAFT_1077030 [Mycena alexandri]|uniref:Uncharacterized protein n=1 Tax=Mycena alexandri TaxID=1745969 RepID=A0AAD6TB93_9AGAR|nr:hypothetical protein C8F04DRAFT_1077030 [Mycena alexandri]